MQAVDTNILVYAEVRGVPHHAAARRLLRSLSEGGAAWALPWPCVYEFLRVITHPRVFHPPVPLAVARRDLAAILGSPSLLLLAETELHAAILDQVLAESGVTGNLVFDARIVALCREHGVTELLTVDGDFARFRGVRPVNPFA